jgi:hypothetical protein
MGMDWGDVIVMLIASALFAFAVAASVFFVSMFVDAMIKIVTTRTLDPLFTLIISLLLAMVSGFIAIVFVFAVGKAGE